MDLPEGSMPIKVLPKKGMHRRLTDYRLTPKQTQIAKAALSQKTAKELSQEVGLSVRTVKYHLQNIYAKLGVRSRTEFVMFMYDLLES